MKKTFVCSLCHRGLLGGALYLDAQNLTYRTNKLTAEPRFRNLILPLNEIADLTWNQGIFPVATVRMNDGEEFRFLIFNKNGFIRYFQEYSRQV